MTTAMTTIEVRIPTQTVEAFFDAYRRHEVDEMVDLCTPNADFSYVPVEIWGRQRVVRGEGKVATIGKTLWTGLITSFPDLWNTVASVRAGASVEGGSVVAVEVTIGGTQASAWANISARGGSFAEPHLFVFRCHDGLIDGITAYWNNASISRQLAHLEID
ncbi:nuclear transport factor 2 family protein [Pseudonocardia sp.]|uniref:nuclear transport factor 2 family protein n=1 Tax=Pseudonocardia sp. TaxID=60912 RepID=UPI002625FF58|nr:nuclear transport factor 2 family protein [Pseudonocardia sp.]